MSDTKARAKKLADYIGSLMDAITKSECSCLNDASSELSMQELKTLKIIGDKKQCIMREISDHLMMAMSTLTSIMDNLVKKKFVTRYRPDEDRRIVKVQLTDKGKEIYKIDRDHHVQVSEGMLKYLNGEEQVMLLNLLEKINYSFKNEYIIKA